VWLLNRVRMSCSACQAGPSVPYWFPAMVGASQGSRRRSSRPTRKTRSCGAAAPLETARCSASAFLSINCFPAPAAAHASLGSSARQRRAALCYAPANHLTHLIEWGAPDRVGRLLECGEIRLIHLIRLIEWGARLGAVGLPKSSLGFDCGNRASRAMAAADHRVSHVIGQGNGGADACGGARAAFFLQLGLRAFAGGNLRAALCHLSRCKEELLVQQVRRAAFDPSPPPPPVSCTTTCSIAENQVGGSVAVAAAWGPGSERRWTDVAGGGGRCSASMPPRWPCGCFSVPWAERCAPAFAGRQRRPRRGACGPARRGVRLAGRLLQPPGPRGRGGDAVPGEPRPPAAVRVPQRRGACLVCPAGCPAVTKAIAVF
jgi:hypothetical protein